MNRGSTSLNNNGDSTFAPTWAQSRHEPPQRLSASLINNGKAMFVPTWAQAACTAAAATALG